MSDEALQPTEMPKASETADTIPSGLEEDAPATITVHEDDSKAKN